VGGRSPTNITGGVIESCFVAIPRRPRHISIAWKTLETMLRYLADVNATDSVQAMDRAVLRLAAS
jgi:hypothetical protein